MVRFAVIEDKPHTTTPSESRLFWYDFLCHYSRGEDGSVQYMQGRHHYPQLKEGAGPASGGPRSSFRAAGDRTCGHPQLPCSGAAERASSTC